ncbi:peptidoglycan hydrolase [Halobacillus fulvus]|nr:peptidoglycan hydrolase [Halobacillus fulvus]
MKRKKRWGILTIASIIFLGIGLYFFPFPSNEQVDYFPFDRSIVYQNEVYNEHPVQLVNEHHYIPLNFLQEQIDEHVMYDESSQSLIMTRPQDMYRLIVEKESYFRNYKEETLSIPPLIERDNALWIAVKWIEQVYPLYVETIPETKTLLLADDGTKWREGIVQSDIGKDEARIRQKPTVASPYYTNLVPGDKLYVTGEERRFYQVRTESGIGGYLPKSSIEVGDLKTLESRTKEKPSSFIRPLEKPFHMTWDAIYTPTATPDEAGNFPGVRVLSPTWFTLSDPSGEIDSFASEDYVTSAHQNGDQVWALFSNDFDPELTNQVLPFYEKRKRMIQQLLDFAKDYQLDGINVDFENVYLDDGPYFTQFIREFTTLAHKQDLVISVDITFPSGSDQWSEFYDRESLAELADYLIVMAYDEHWATSPVAGSVASLPWVEQNVQRLLEEVPSDHLLLGIPFYTRLWEEQVNGGELTSRALSMEEAERWIEENGAQTEFDDSTGQTFVSVEKANTLYKMWLENPISIGARLDIMETYDLAGVASWSQSFANDQAFRTIEERLNE